jgi:hypothetical protein
MPKAKAPRFLDVVIAYRGVRPEGSGGARRAKHSQFCAHTLQSFFMGTFSQSKPEPVWNHDLQQPIPRFFQLRL